MGYKSVPGGIFDVEDAATGFLRLNNGTTIDYDFSWASNIEKESKYVELLGTKGGMSFVDGEMKFFTQLGDTCYTLQPDVKTIPTAQNEYQHFVNCILQNREPMATPEQAYDVMKVIDAVYASAAARKEVTISYEGDINLVKFTG